jgi:tape measure domain-containing protein
MAEVRVVLKADGSGLTGTLRIARSDFDALEREMEQTSAAARKTARAVDEIGVASDRNSAKNRSLAASFNTVRGTVAALGLAFASREMLNAGLTLDRIERGLTAASGGSRAAASDMAFLRSESARLGLEFANVAQGYVMIAASARGTNMEGRQTRELFTAIAEASRVYNLTLENTIGISNAVSQIIGKQVVSLEELRGQLGDRLPGAMQIAARAMDMPVSKLMQLVAEGKVAADDFLPKFAAELRKTTAASIEFAAASPSAEFARLKNSIFDLLTGVADGGALDALSTSAARLGNALDALVQSGAAEAAGQAIGELVENLDTLIVMVAAVAGARGVVALVPLFRSLATSIALTATPMAAFAVGANASATAMGTMAVAGSRAFALMGGWVTVIGALVAATYVLATAETEREQQYRATSAELERHIQLLREEADAKRASAAGFTPEESQRATAYEKEAQELARFREELRLAEIQMANLGAGGDRLTVGLKNNLGQTIEDLREKIETSETRLRTFTDLLVDTAIWFDGAAESARNFAAGTAELNESLEGQLVKLQAQRIEQQQGVQAAMLWSAMQKTGAKSVAELDAKTVALIADIAGLTIENDNFAKSQRAAEEATRKQEQAQAQYAAIVSRLMDEIDPLNEAEREHANLAEQLTEWVKAKAISETQYAKAINLSTQALKAQNAERKKQLNDSERRFIDQGYQAQEQRDEELNRMREEIELLKLSGIEREKLIDFFDAERYAMNLSGVEREKAIRDFVRLRAEMRATAIDSNLAEEWAANWKEAIQSVFSTFLNALKGGASFGDALKQSIQGALDGVLDKHIKKFSDALGQWASGGGTGGLTARGANGMPVWANGLISLGAGLTQGWIGSENTLQSAAGGALSGLALGSQLGAALGPIGMAIGAVLGAIAGAISSQKPYLEVSSSAGNINRGRVEGTATSAFGTIYVGKDDLTLPGNMSSQELANNIAKFDDTIAKLLNATELAAARQALARFDVNQSGGNNIDPEKILEQRLRAVINAVEPQFARFLNGITDIQERVETFTALREMREMIEDFGQVVDRLSLDPLVSLQNALQALEDTADEAVANLYEALDAKDIKGAAVALGQAQQAIVNQYQQQVSLLQQLRQQLIALADAQRNFRMEMAQRINANGGDISIAGMVAADLPAMQASVTNEQNTERAIANLNRFITAVDQWLAASIGEIQAAAQAARDRIATQLSALDAEEAGIMANAQAAMAAAQAAAQGAADAARAALEAERARLQRELQVAQAFQGVLQTAETLLSNLRLSSANPLAESARAAMLERDIEAARASYNSATGEERAAAAQRLLELLQQRMQFAQSLNQRPSEEYLRVYNATLAETAGLRAEAQSQADRARQLQEELNALQSANVDATNNVANVIDYVSAADRARLAEIETERTRLQNELAEINRQEAEDIAAARAEARGYYEWAQTVGEDLYERRHQELMQQVNAITGGREIDVFIAEQTAAVQERLREIRDRLDAFLSGISTGTGAGTNPGTGPGSGGGGNPRVPGDPGVEPIRPRTAGETSVTQHFTFNVSPGTDPKDFGEKVMRFIETNSPRIRRAVAT